MFTSKWLRILGTAIFLLNNSMPAFALPQGEDLKAGDATFTRSGNDLNIQQHTDKMIADYQGFSIGANEAVNFLQPSSSSIALNRVVGADPSNIFGRLTATGRVFLINPNGVLFGSTAHVDTAGLVASAMNISNSDFMAGRYRFVNAGGSVVNEGVINSPGGYVVLLGSHVANSGIIEADLGSVAMASGNKITLNLDPKGLISVAITEPLQNGSGKEDGVKNTGTISAAGGRVILTAQGLKGVFKNSVNNEGIVSAASLVNRNGEIYLVAEGGDSNVVNTGTLDASAAGINGDGGFIETSAAHLDLAHGFMSAADKGGNPGTILLDPSFFTIDDTWQSLFGAQNGSNITVLATEDVDFNLTSGVLDLVNFNTETFTVHAGRDIDQNGATVITHGGNVSFLADTGNVNLSAPIKTNGGNVDIQATQGNVVHNPGADVLTANGNFRGKAGNDYTVGNGVTVNTGNGVLDIYAGRDIVLGAPGNSAETFYNWQYLSDDRLYSLKAIGYYYFNGTEIIYVPIVQGHDIGKDGVSPLSRSGLLQGTDGFGLYTVFDRGNSGAFFPSDTSGTDVWLYHTDPTLNLDGHPHVDVNGSKYSWEDVYSGGDHDFDDVEFNLTQTVKTFAPGVTLSTNTNMFLTANQGAITQTQGNIHADNLVLSTNKGATGTAANGGLATDVNNIAALNKTSGNIIISNDKNLNVKDLSALNGLNSAVHGQNGITNNAQGGKIVADAQGNETIDAPINGKGDIELDATGNITQTANGNVTIDNSVPLAIGPPKDVKSTSHQVNTWSNEPTIDVTWRLPDLDHGCCGSFKAVAGGTYTMQVGSKVVTDNGNATVTANGNVALSLIDSGNGDASVTSHNGSIIDNDLGTTPTDYDVIGHAIQLSAPNGTVGQPGAGHEIDTGYPLSFSFLFDEASANNPDLIPDSFTATLESSGQWLFGASYKVPNDGDHWWFHVRTVDVFHGLSSSSVHLGPFLIDTIAPIITATYDPANSHGWYNHDVTVHFSAADERSGFAPGGLLSATLPSKTSTGEGVGLIVTSDGITDRAGNHAVIVSVPLNVDKTAPVITSGTPQGTHGEGGTFTSDVTVPFHATDNLSGFAPGGSLDKDLPSKTTTGTGSGLTVTSDTIEDLAGNPAVPVNAGPFAVTPPVTTPPETTPPVTTPPVTTPPETTPPVTTPPVTTPPETTPPVTTPPVTTPPETTPPVTTPPVTTPPETTPPVTTPPVTTPPETTPPITTPPVTLPPGGFVPSGSAAFGDVDGLNRQFRVYYEILSPSQFLSFEPALKIGLFAYHPLTETDDSQYEGFKLDASAYEFIEDNIKLKKQLPTYFKE